MISVKCISSVLLLDSLVYRRHARAELLNRVVTLPVGALDMHRLIDVLYLPWTWIQIIWYLQLNLYRLYTTPPISE